MEADHLGVGYENGLRGGGWFEVGMVVRETMAIFFWGW